MPSSGGTFALAHQGSSDRWGRSSTSTSSSEFVNLNSTTVTVEANLGGSRSDNNDLDGG